MLWCLCLLGKNPWASEGPSWVHSRMAGRAIGSWELEQWDSEVHRWVGIPAAENKPTEVYQVSYLQWTQIIFRLSQLTMGFN